nr:MAG TPA: hypothetical protein [Caudoviricetes sp.]
MVLFFCFYFKIYIYSFKSLLYFVFIKLEYNKRKTLKGVYIFRIESII